MRRCEWIWELGLQGRPVGLHDNGGAINTAHTPPALTSACGLSRRRRNEATQRRARSPVSGAGEVAAVCEGCCGGAGRVCLERDGNGHANRRLPSKYAAAASSHRQPCISLPFRSPQQRSRARAAIWIPSVVPTIRPRLALRAGRREAAVNIVSGYLTMRAGQ